MISVPQCPCIFQAAARPSAEIGPDFSTGGASTNKSGRTSEPSPVIDSGIDISVVICTRHRPESLRETLACLARADKRGLRCEVVVVDNGEGDETAAVAREPVPDLRIHYLVEPLTGKSHALNRALDGAPLGNLVAVLDDDMSPHADWFHGVRAISDRWPDKEFFSGTTYVIWPVREIPAWCQEAELHGWAFSVLAPKKDEVVGDGRWCSGNHFWFRSRVLADGRRFDSGNLDLRTHIETSEPQFMLRLMEEGRGGVMAPDAVCGHRVQPELLSPEVIRKRAVRCGRGFAEARLRPCRRSVHQARQFRQHPVMARGFCVLRLLKWSAVRAAAGLNRVPGRQTARELHAEMEIAYYCTLLEIASQMPEYRLLPSFLAGIL